MKDDWSPEDESLEADIPSDLQIYRCEWARSVNRNPSTSRIRAMIALGMSIIEKQKPSLIFVTMSPFEDAEIASELSARTGIPWVADLRDPWALDEFQVFRSWFHRKLARRRMEKSLSSASLIIMNTPESKDRFERAFPGQRTKLVCITNGYDSSDFEGPAINESPGKFTIVHTGHFHTAMGLRQKRRVLEYRLLGRVEAGVEFLPRSHFYLIRALEHLKKANPEITKNMRVCCVGEAKPDDLNAVNRSSVASLFEFLEFLPHEQSVKKLRAADLLFLPMHKMPEGRRASIVPGKTYEYLAARRPVLGAVPPGDARDFLVESSAGRLCEPDDFESMARIIEEQHANWARSDLQFRADEKVIAKFERKNLTAQLAQLLFDHTQDVLLTANPRTGATRAG